MAETGDRDRVPTPRSLDAGEPRLGVDVAGKPGERLAVGPGRVLEPPHVEEGVAELDHRPCDVLGDRRVRLQRELVGRGGAGRTTEELAGVRDPRDTRVANAR